MSSGEKKGKPKTSSKPKPSKEVPLNDQRFRGEGVKFKCKMVGSADVSSAKGDSVCAEAIKKLKLQALKLNKESGEHKQRIVMYITLKGIRIVDEKTQKLQHEHPINKISFITHDPEDKRTFGYVCSQSNCTTGHKLYAIKSDKPAGTVTGTLYELFQIVFRMRQEAGLSKKVQNSSQLQKPPQVSNGPSLVSSHNSDGIYEVPYKNGNKKQVKPSGHVDHEYAEPIPLSARNEPYYKVPNSPLPVAPSTQTAENQEDAKVNKQISTSSPLLNRVQSFDKEPDQVSQASIPESPFPTRDNSSVDVAFFSPSVFDTGPNESGMGDTVSVASSADISMLRSDSVSSGSSETRSRHSRSSSLIHQTATVEGIQPGLSTTFDDAGSGGTKTAGSDQGQLAESESQEKFSVAFPSSDHVEDPERKGNAEVSVDQVATNNPDPFAPSEASSDPFASTSKDEGTLLVSGERLFTESFAAFDSAFGNSAEGSQVKDDFLSNDPFCRSEDVTESAEGFTSEPSFEAVFPSTQFTPSLPNTGTTTGHSHSGTDETGVEEKRMTVENSVLSFSGGNSVREMENEPQPVAAQKTDEDKGRSSENFSESFAYGIAESESQQVSATSENAQFSWAESFTSDDVTANSGPTTAASVSWDDAFGTAPDVSKESSGQHMDDFSWDDAFGKKTIDNSGSLFDSSPFGDAFTSSSEGSSNENRGGPQPSVPNSAFMTSLASQTAESNADGEAAQELPNSSKDPSDEFKSSFIPPATKPEIVRSEEASNSRESDSSNVGVEVAAFKDNLSSKQNAKDNIDLKQSDESVDHTEDHELESTVKSTEKEQMKEERPSGLQIQESEFSLSERPVSPTAPPPLPPRPSFSAPPLPVRPSGSSSTVSPVKSPMSPNMSIGSQPSNSPHGKKGSAKKTPPPPPPRVDLNEESVPMSSNQKADFPDPFGSDLFENNFGNNNDEQNYEWTTTWPSTSEIPPKEKQKELSDPFSDSFFTDFDFPQNSGHSKEFNDNVDPFTSTNPSSEPFPAAFGSEDLFAAFTPAKVDVAFSDGDPFQNDLSDSFSAFPSSDPFSDISDPFADKGVLSDDPFGDSPTKPCTGESLTLNESLTASEEADSFA